MTLEEYYIEWEKAKEQIPDGLNSPQRSEWYRTKRKALQDQLSEEDLAIVLERQRRWQEKMQSSVG